MFFVASPLWTYSPKVHGPPGHRFAEPKPEYEEPETPGAHEHNLIAVMEKTLKSLKINSHDCTSTHSFQSRSAGLSAPIQQYTFSLSRRV